MKRMKKLILACLSAIAVCGTGAGIIGLNGEIAAAETAAQAAISVAGASVRKKDFTGMRFHTLVEGGKQGNCEYGTLMIPEKEFSGEELTLKTENVLNIPAAKWQSDTEYTAVLGGVENEFGVTDIPVSKFNANILCRSYVKDANGAVTYSTVESRTLGGIASKALADTTAEGKIDDEESRAFLAAICDEILGADGFAFAEASISLTVGQNALELDSLFSLQNGNENLTAVWEIVRGEEYVKLNRDEIGAGISVSPKSAGEAVLKATIGTKQAELTANVSAREIAANEVFDFKYESDLVLANVVEKEANTISEIGFLSEFQGASGVAKITSANWGRWSFTPIQPMENYDEYAYLVARIWVETEATDGFLYIKETSSKSLSTMQTGRWIDYYFSGETFKSQWTDIASYYSSMATNRAGTYYIDKIYMTNEFKLIDFAHSADLASAKNKVDLNSLEYVDEYQGAKGVLKVDAKHWGCLGFTPIMLLDNYSVYKYIVIRMNASVSCNLQIAQNNGTPLNLPVANEWTDVYFNASAFVNQWKDSGNYYSALIFKSAGIFYIDKIYAANAPENLIVLDFYNETFVNANVGDGWDTNISYLAEYQGAKGVLKVEAKNYGCVSFKSLVDLSMASDYKYLAIRAYAETPFANSGADYIKLVYGSNNTVKPIAGQWVEYLFDIQAFVNSWTTDTPLHYKSSLNFGYAGNFYIDEIYMTNTEPQV